MIQIKHFVHQFIFRVLLGRVQEQVSHDIFVRLVNMAS